MHEKSRKVSIFIKKKINMIESSAIITQCLITVSNEYSVLHVILKVDVY